jgi:hypothetical protein
LKSVAPGFPSAGAAAAILGEKGYEAATMTQIA